MNKKQRICKGSHKSRTSNRNTVSMQAGVGTCISVTTGKSCTMSFKKSVFHLMLQNNVAPNIGHNCQAISGL